MSKIFAVSNHRYINIHHTKKHAENILSCCSILSLNFAAFLTLKTLFLFILKCILVPHLESGVMVERLFLAVPRGCLLFVIVVFPDHTHLLFLCKLRKELDS